MNSKIPGIFRKRPERHPKKKVLEKMFEVDRLDPTQRKILRETKSLSNHEELKADGSKWYAAKYKYRQLYEANSFNVKVDYNQLTY